MSKKTLTSDLKGKGISVVTDNYENNYNDHDWGNYCVKCGKVLCQCHHTIGKETKR